MLRISALLSLLTVLPMAALAAPDHHHAAQPTHHAPEHHAPVRHAPERHTPEHHTAKPPPVVHAPHPAPRVAVPAVPAPAPAPSVPAAPAAPAEPAKGTNTGLPLPRFASLKTDEVNLRSGPGLRYPIEWVYKRRDLPVEIQREFEVWRLVADSEWVKGWVHQATLTGRRSFVITGGPQMLRDDNRPDAGAVAQLKPGVVGRIRKCDDKADWCQVSVGDYRGWLPRTAFWGSYPGEAIQ